MIDFLMKESFECCRQNILNSTKQVLFVNVFIYQSISPNTHPHSKSDSLARLQFPSLGLQD